MAINKKTRKEVYSMYAGHCSYCGEKIEYKDMQVDHVIPQHHHSEIHGCLIVGCKKFTEYSVDDIRNLKPACRICNKFKTSFTLEEFREELQIQLERARKYSVNFRMAERYGLVIKTGYTGIEFYFEKVMLNVK